MSFCDIDLCERPAEQAGVAREARVGEADVETTAAAGPYSACAVLDGTLLPESGDHQ
jgi:hypothetical protein